MRAMQRPAYAVDAGFEACTNDINEAHLKERLITIAPAMRDAALHYDQLARTGALHQMPRSDRRDNELEVGLVTKGELKNLYDVPMVKRRTSSARAIYDDLRAAAPNGRCPTCGLGQVSTLDHFLPKSSFPSLSVSVDNLVPACRDCNTQKGSRAAPDAQSFHPYYDVSPLMRDRWLFAEILPTNPVSAQYFVRPPQNWTPLLATRAANHFREYDLARRFATEAASEISALIPTLTQAPRMSPPEVRSSLARRLHGYRQQQCNSWQIGLFEALHDCVWFYNLEFDANG